MGKRKLLKSIGMSELPIEFYMDYVLYNRKTGHFISLGRVVSRSNMGGG